MSTFTKVAPGLTSVVVHPASKAGRRYRDGRKDGIRAKGFTPRPGLNLRYFGGKTVEHLTFTNVYLGGAAAWTADDMHQIDSALPAAAADPHLNNVLAQYFVDGKPSAAFKPSRVLEGPLPTHVFRDTLEGFVAGLDQANGLSGFDLGSTLFCFYLPRGIVLVDGTSAGGTRKAHAEHDGDDGGNVALHERDEAADSKHGLGGYHGSIHTTRGSRKDTVYYAVAVYSDVSNGIPSFPTPWKSICATMYHELCEWRTDPDVEDAIRAGSSPKANDFIGWYSDQGGEIGDIPMEEAGANLGLVMKEVPLANGKGTVPIQLMWSNAVSGPEGPIATKHPAARRS